MAGEIKLSVVSDDFGMHPAVNEGIVETFEDGLLTDTNLMAPCPGFQEAIKLTKAHHIPVGLHATFTCEWDRFTWGPLTQMTTQVTNIGNQRDQVVTAWCDADEETALVELRAQYDAVEAEGVSMTHVGEHMGVDEAGKFVRVMAALAEEKKVPHKGTWDNYEQRSILHYEFKSTFVTTGRRKIYKERKALLKPVLFGLQPGHHLWVVHAGVDHPSLDEICSPDSRVVRYARLNRALDRLLLLDSEVKDWVAELGVEMVPLASGLVKAPGDS